MLIFILRERLDIFNNYQLVANCEAFFFFIFMTLEDKLFEQQLQSIPGESTIYAIVVIFVLMCKFFEFFLLFLKF